MCDLTADVARPRAAADSTSSHDNALGDVLTALRHQLDGQVLEPHHAGYHDAVTGFDLAAGHRPPVAVVAHSVADVAVTLRVADRHGVPVTVVGGGHGDIPVVDTGIWLTTRGLRDVRVDADARTAHVQTGCTWQEVIAAAAPVGLVPLCGAAPAVGVGGYLLGGGLGPLARTYGFSSDHVRAFEVVLADGRRVVASADEHRDLFGALRGGKGGFGVVTAVTLDLLDPPDLYGGSEYYPAVAVAPLLRAYARFISGDVPAELTTSLAVLRLPDLPVLPPPLRGQLVAHLRVAHVGPAAVAERLLAPLRAAGGSPLLGGLRPLPYEQIGTIHQDPTHPSGHATAGVLLHRFDTGTADALLAVAGPDVSTPLAIVEVRHLGGATRRTPASGDSVGGRTAGAHLWVSGSPLADPGDRVALAASGVVVRGVLDAVRGSSAGAAQINFCGSHNTAAEARRAWSPAVFERLELVRRRYDPQGRLASSLLTTSGQQPRELP